MTRQSRFFRSVALITICMLMLEVVAPTIARALTGGPTQPEFGSFEPVASTNMVNEFTGAFSYNLPVLSVPGPQGFGYALSLSYHNTSSVEDEASWVGLGWSLNPGSITRVKRGLPDEYKNAEVRYWHQVPDHWTATVTKVAIPEAYSADFGNLYTTQRYNNYRGFGYINGGSLSIVGMASLGFQEVDGQSCLQWGINPAAVIASLSIPYVSTFFGQIDWTLKSSIGQMLMSNLELNTGLNPNISSSGGVFGITTFNDYLMPWNNTPYSGEIWSGGGEVQMDFVPNIGSRFGVSGKYVKQEATHVYSRPGYGYMYSHEVTNKPSAVMDYYSEKDEQFHNRDLFIGMPFSNPDYFIATGEGIQGSFRLHRRHPGHFRPPSSVSTADIYHFDLGVHIGLSIGAGGDGGGGTQTLSVNKWQDGILNSNPVTFKGPTQYDEPYFYRFSEDLGGGS